MEVIPITYLVFLSGWGCEVNEYTFWGVLYYRKKSELRSPCGAQAFPSRSDVAPHSPATYKNQKDKLPELPARLKLWELDGWFKVQSFFI